MYSRWLSVPILLLCPVALAAADGTPVPEASSSVLFALGVLGVIVGRYASRRRKGERPD